MIAKAQWITSQDGSLVNMDQVSLSCVEQVEPSDPDVFHVVAYHERHRRKFTLFVGTRMGCEGYKDRLKELLESQIVSWNPVPGGGLIGSEWTTRSILEKLRAISTDKELTTRGDIGPVMRRIEDILREYS